LPASSNLSFLSFCVPAYQGSTKRESGSISIRISSLAVRISLIWRSEI
jgi:hypothetical protein